MSFNTSRPFRYVWEILSGVEGDFYPDSPRPELVNLTSGNPQRALDVGCHKGAVGAALKKRFPGLECIGVELNEVAASEAKKRLDAVLTFDLLSPGAEAHPSIAPGFDMIILADVLEHLYDPWRMLKTLKSWLRPGGRVYVSLPNVRNLKLLSDLINGSWRYEPAGLLDITHIRFFALPDALKMFAETGFHVLEVRSVRDGRIPFEVKTEPVDLTLPNFTIHKADQRMQLELSTIQFLFVLEVRGQMHPEGIKSLDSSSIS